MIWPMSGSPWGSDWSATPCVGSLILGLILGPLAEQFFRTAMSMADNDPTVFFTRPISLVFLMASFASLGLPVYRQWAKSRQRASVALKSVS
jgi:TctA family transporter